MNIYNIEIFEKMGVSKFKRLRKDMNFTQSELAEKLGRKKNYIVTHEQNGIPKDLSLAMSALYILTLKRRFKIVDFIKNNPHELIDRHMLFDKLGYQNMKFVTGDTDWLYKNGLTKFIELETE